MLKLIYVDVEGSSALVSATVSSALVSLTPGVAAFCASARFASNVAIFWLASLN